MKKSVLVVYYSHTGQLKEIIHNFMECWNDTWNVDYMEITTEQYQFPITWYQMFNMMPESVLGIPCIISYPKKDYSSYDFIVMGFQPWFMHPSIPFNSFTETTDFKEIVKDKPVYIITDCRNSRRNAIRIVEDKIYKNNGFVKGNSVFWDDSSGNLIGAFTLLKWLFSGHKKKLLGILPPAGVRQSIIEDAPLYGNTLLKQIEIFDTKTVLETNIYPLKKIEFTSEGYEENVINRFRKWANYIIENKQKRKWRLFKFQAWLIFTIIFIAPFISRKNKVKE